MKLRPAAFLPEILRNFFKKPATQIYPFKKYYPPDGFRGTPVLNPDNCTVCKACERDCPAEAIEISTVSQEEKRFKMMIHNDRCVHCAQCVDSCSFDAMNMTMEFELATDDRNKLKAEYVYVRALPPKKPTPPAPTIPPA
jgi:formate hydrogenlyase subunit 6/NADH:ubiquinone oxidoreductase subunit I